MHANTSIAERIAYGRPLEPEVELERPVMPRPMTALIGRILIAAIFLMSGIAKLVDTAGTVEHMTAAGIPEPHVLAIIAGVAEVLGALAIIFGLLTRVGAIGLIVFMAVTTAVFHGFWDFEGTEQKMQMVQFMKNLSIMGGLCLLVAYGPGRYSIDAKIRRPMQP